MTTMKIRQREDGALEASCGKAYTIGFYPTPETVVEVDAGEVLALCMGVGWYMFQVAGMDRQEFMSNVLSSAREIADTFAPLEKGPEDE